MTNNYVIFDTNGLLSDSTLYPISRGNHNVDAFKVAFTEYDYDNTYMTVAVTLPDGHTLPQLATSISDFKFKNKSYKGYKFVVTEPMTSQAGTVTMTFVVKSKEDDSRLCTSQLNVTIYDSDVATSTTITDAQLENIMITIDNTGKELDDKKLNKDFTQYPHTFAKDEDLIAIYNREDRTNGSIPVSATYNITSINGVEPVDKSVVINAYDIPYNEKSTGAVLDETIEDLSRRVPYSEGVTHRSGVDIEIETPAFKGLLPYTYIVNDPEKDINVAEIYSNGYDFQAGDIINLDVTFSAFGEKGTTTVNKTIIYLYGSKEIYRVPLFTSVDGLGQAGMLVEECGYTISITSKKITITGIEMHTSINSVFNDPTITLSNIAILRP